MVPILLLVRLCHLDGVARMRRLACCALFASLAWTSPALAAPTIHVLLSEPAGIYLAAAESLTRELKRHPGDWKINTLTLDRYASQDGDLTIAVGTRALQVALAQPGRPVLSLLVPRLTYERLASGKSQ